MSLFDLRRCDQGAHARVYIFFQLSTLQPRGLYLGFLPPGNALEFRACGYHAFKHIVDTPRWSLLLSRPAPGLRANTKTASSLPILQVPVVGARCSH